MMHPAVMFEYCSAALSNLGYIVPLGSQHIHIHAELDVWTRQAHAASAMPPGLSAVHFVKLELLDADGTYLFGRKLFNPIRNVVVTPYL